MILDTLPLDDVKESLIALSSNEEEMNNLINYQFKYGSLKSLSFGDIYLLAMQNLHKEFGKSVEKSKDIFNMTGRVLPVTQDWLKLKGEAELADCSSEERETILQFINEQQESDIEGQTEALENILEKAIEEQNNSNIIKEDGKDGRE